MNVLLPPDVLDRMLVERTGQRDEARRRADTHGRKTVPRADLEQAYRRIVVHGEDWEGPQ